MITLTKEAQQKLTPTQALNLLKEGNKRFVNDTRLQRNLLQQVRETAGGQFPFAIILSCIDSRTSPELIFDQGLGDIFSVRIAGNIINEDVLGSLEFGCKIAGAKLIVVLGHTRCGAISGACNQVQMGNLSALLQKIQPAIDQEKKSPGKNEMNKSFLDNVSKNNVSIVVQEIKKQSNILQEMEQQQQIKITGGVYDTDNGQVIFFE